MISNGFRTRNKKGTPRQDANSPLLKCGHTFHCWGSREVVDFETRECAGVWRQWCGQPRHRVGSTRHHRKGYWASMQPCLRARPRRKQMHKGHTCPSEPVKGGPMVSIPLPRVRAQDPIPRVRAGDPPLPRIRAGEPPLSASRPRRRNPCSPSRLRRNIRFLGRQHLC